MVAYLVKYSKRSTHQHTISKLNKLITFTIETGTATTCVAIGGLVVYRSTGQGTAWYYMMYNLHRLFYLRGGSCLKPIP